MKHLKLIAVTVGLILVVSATAGASTPPWGCNYIAHMYNYDASRMYNGLKTGGDPVTTGIWYDPGELQYTDPSGGYTGETGWGIFKIDQVFEAEVDSVAQNFLKKVTPDNEVWKAGQGDMDIVGIFYDQVDVKVQFYIDIATGNLTQVILSKDAKYEMWYQPTSNYDPEVGTFGRFGQDKYVGVGYEWNDANNNGVIDAGETSVIAGAEKVLEAGSQGGFFPTADGFGAEYVIDFTTVTMTGTQNVFISITGGPWQPYMDLNIFPCGTGTTPSGETADMRLDVQLNPTGAGQMYGSQYEWDLISSDPLYGGAVPEPITMLGLFLGVGSLAGYIRKRRKA